MLKEKDGMEKTKEKLNAKGASQEGQELGWPRTGARAPWSRAGTACVHK